MVERKRTPRADGDQTRARLLEVAGQLFAQHGYAGTASKLICETAGADLAAINYHFGGRDGLYLAVLLEGYEQLVSLESLSEIHARDVPAEERLSAVLGIIVDRLFDEQGWYGRVLAREILAPSNHFSTLVQQGVMPRFQLMRSILSEITGYAPDDPALLRCVLSVIAPCLMLLVIGRDTPSPFSGLLAQPPEDLKKHLTRFVMAGLEAVKKNAASSTTP